MKQRNVKWYCNNTWRKISSDQNLNRNLVIITDKSIYLPHKSYSSSSMVLILQHVAETLEGLDKIKSLDPTHRVSDSVGLGSGPEICTSNKFPDKADAWCCWSRAHFENNCSRSLTHSTYSEYLLCIEHYSRCWG